MSIYYSQFRLNTYRVTPYFEEHIPPDYPLDLILQKARCFNKLPPHLKKLSALAKKWAERVMPDSPVVKHIKDWYDYEGNELDPDTGYRLTSKEIEDSWGGHEAPDISVEDIPIPDGGFPDPDTWEKLPPEIDEPEERVRPTRERLLSLVASHGRERVSEEYGIPVEDLPESDAKLSVDTKGHSHKGKGTGGGQFTKGSGSDDKTDGNMSPPDVFAATKKLARAKIKNVPVPTTEQITKARVELQLAREGKIRAGGENRGGGSQARRKQRENLFKEFGGEERGYICCHGCGRKLHHTVPNDSNLERLERGKIFVKCQGGGYQLPNLLPECFSCNRSRNDDQVRKDIKC